MPPQRAVAGRTASRATRQRRNRRDAARCRHNRVGLRRTGRRSGRAAARSRGVLGDGRQPAVPDLEASVHAESRGRADREWPSNRPSRRDPCPASEDAGGGRARDRGRGQRLRERQARRAHLRLLRPGPGRQRLVLRRAHRRVRARPARRPRRSVAGRQAWRQAGAVHARGAEGRSCVRPGERARRGRGPDDCAGRWPSGPDPARVFRGCIKVRDFSPLDRATEFKYYCPGVGIAREIESGARFDVVSFG